MISIDVSAWEPAGEEYLGTKPKQWLRSPEGDLWLWKESTFNLDSHGEPYRKGDDWAEVVAGRVGLSLGVPVATVELASRRDRLGVVSKRVFDDDTEGYSFTGTSCSPRSASSVTALAIEVGTRW